MPSIDEIARALKAKRSGANRIARCPAHNDKTPSLFFCEKNGKILLHCHGGCTQRDVIAALRNLGLWPEPKRRDSQRTHSDYDSDFPGDLARAEHFRVATRLMAEAALSSLPAETMERRGLTRLLTVINGSNAGLVAEYRAWRERYPQLTSALVNTGRRSRARKERTLALWIRGGLGGH